MTTMQPYLAWFFFGADDTDEVNAEYEKMVDAMEEDGSHLTPQLAEVVTVVSADMRRGMELVWFVRKGRLEARDSWMLRKML